MREFHGLRNNRRARRKAARAQAEVTARLIAEQEAARQHFWAVVFAVRLASYRLGETARGAAGCAPLGSTEYKQVRTIVENAKDILDVAINGSATSRSSDGL